MRNWAFIIVLAAIFGVLLFVRYGNMGKGSPGLSENRHGAIRVPATVLWREPGLQRDYDNLIVKKNNDPAAWAGGMDTSMRQWLVGKAESMALYGEPVFVLEKRGEWLKVAAAEQKTTLNENGYPGWVPAAHVVDDQTFLDSLRNLPGVMVVKKFALLYDSPERNRSCGEVSYQTRLPLLEEQEGAVKVLLPGGGTGFLAKSDIKKTGIPTYSRENMIEEARQFLGLRYIWAGTAAYGFDCSGLPMRLYQSQGLSIPRDADEQAMEGSPVDRDELLPGDLLFFAVKGGLGQIHHVGMYIGDGMMLHAPNSGSPVRIEAVDNEPYRSEYWGARRYVP